ncbi:MAG: MopE-related protein [Acidobacteriota bacterium]|nr:MopE-related protein [Acidobacteriota bacterium]
MLSSSVPFRRFPLSVPPSPRPRLRTVFCLLLAGVGFPHAQAGSACPDGDRDFYADCTVDGCTPTLPCGDCHDADPAIHPGVEERCDLVDNDCNGATDEGFAKAESRIKWLDPGRQDGDGAGRAVAGLSDVTGDGVPDIAIGATRIPITGSRDSVMVVSGADRSLWCRIIDPTGTSDFGGAVAGLGDIDGDGTPDLAVGRPYGSGTVFLYSGSDCRELARCEDVTAGRLGFSLASIPDLNGDGFPEILAGAIQTDVADVNDAGRIDVFSFDGGGCVLHMQLELPEGQTNGNLGSAVAAAPDMTGDGVPEIIAGAWGTVVSNRNSAGSVALFSGADGAYIRSMTDPRPENQANLGQSVAAVPDMDGDGTAEIASGAPGWNGGRGAVLFFSGADGSLLCRGEATPGLASGKLGEAITMVGDLDEDGTADLAAGAPHSYHNGKARVGMVAVFSTARCSMVRALFDREAIEGDKLGTSVDSCGDINGDGVDDIVAGAPYVDLPGEIDVGATFFFVHESDCDGDGFGRWGGDCNDDSAAVYPTQVESCIDGIDDNCDGLIDCQDAFFCPPGPGPLPGEIANLVLADDKQTLAWEADPVADVYDLLQGPVDALLAAASFDDADCLAWRVPGTSYQDPTVPDTGFGTYYLVRGKADTCRIGSWGSTLRDQAQGACP